MRNTNKFLKMLIIQCKLKRYKVGFVSVLSLFLTFNFQLLTFNCSAQGVAINTDGSSAAGSAILDVKSTVSPYQGVLLPRLTTAQRDAISTPVESLLIYNTDTKCFEAYNATTSTWVNFGCIGCTLPSATTASTHTSLLTQIVWNWNTISGALGYKWNTVNNYGTATEMNTATIKTETGLTCNTVYTRYVWAYNNCGISVAATLTQSTSTCCSGGPPTSGCSGLTTMTDSRDSKVYSIVQTGSGAGIQCWMAQNLDYGTYVTVATTQADAGTQKYCYGDNTANCSTYGGLYEWAEMMNGSTTCNGDATCPPCTTPVQGICPDGWHIPSHYEWTLLEKNVGSNPGAFPYDVATTGWLGTDEGGNLKEAGTTHWATPNTGATNTSGFTALPSGTSYTGSFSFVSNWGYCWSSTESNTVNAWYRVLNIINASAGREVYSKLSGFSIRCIKD